MWGIEHDSQHHTEPTGAGTVHPAKVSEGIMKCFGCGKFPKQLIRCWIVEILEFANLCEDCLPDHRPGPESLPYEGLGGA